MDANVNPAGYGVPVTVTVTIAHPTGLPTGSVELTGLPGDPRVAPVESGQATFTLEDLDPGDYELVATYVPDGPLEASSDDLTLTIVKQISATVLTVDPAGTSAVGAPVSLTATVRDGADVSGPVPTGEVEFRSGSDVVATATIVAGVATADDVTLAGGLHSLTAVYSGDTGFEGSTSAAVAHSVQSGTSVDLTVASTATYGELLELSAEVAAVGGGAPDATGVVQFVATSEALGSSHTIAFATLSGGVATTTMAAPIPVGEYEVVAIFNGDSHHAGAVSDPSALTVSPAATETALVGPAGASTVSGEPAPFTATVTAADTPAPPDGSVTFSVDGDDVATVPVVGGEATFSPTDLVVTGWSFHTVVATFVPVDDSFEGSESDPVAHTVTKGATTVELSAPAASVAGESVTLAADVDPVAPSVADPVGSVTFWADGTSLGSVALTDGSASLTTSDLPMGASDLSATFAVTSELDASTSDDVTHTVGKADTQLQLTATPGSVVHGQDLTLTAAVTVVAPGGGTPTGTITFSDGGTVLGTGSLDAGVATLALTSLPAGTRALTASYAGAARYEGDAGELSLEVAKATPTVTITSPADESESSFGQPVTMTASVVSPTGSTPTGNVAFTWGGNGNVVGQAPVVNGVATLTLSTLTIGRTIITAQYLGDADHNEAYSPSGSDAS